MKHFLSIFSAMLYWVVVCNSVHAQNPHFNQTMSSAVYSQPALAGFRETPIIGWQYNDNNSFWKSSVLSASVPFSKFGLQAAWIRDSGWGYNFDLLSLSVNKVLEVKKLKAVLAFGLEGSKTGYNDRGPSFPNDPLSSIYDNAQSFTPKRQLAYMASAAIDYRGLLLFATTKGRNIASSREWGVRPLTSFGLGYHMEKGHWRFQALGSHTIYGGPWNLTNEMITARYRFVELGFGGQQATGTGFHPKMQIGAVAKRFKVSYVYLNRNKAYNHLPQKLTWYEHEISFLIGLHKKGSKTDFSLM